MKNILGPQILELKAKGMGYKQIQETLGCSKGTICYHLGVGQKAKNKARAKKIHPFNRKLNRFLTTKSKTKQIPNNLSSNKELLRVKVNSFCHTPGNNNVRTYMKPTFTVEDVIQKFGDSTTTCYLTGQEIDISKPRTYQFDHIIPLSRGGTCELDNLAICTKAANAAKHNMTPDEFVNLCKTVLEHHGYHITK